MKRLLRVFGLTTAICLATLAATPAMAAEGFAYDVVIRNGNIFEELVRAVRVCSLGQITRTLFEVGGQYRRSM